MRYLLALLVRKFDAPPPNTIAYCHCSWLYPRLDGKTITRMS